MNNKIPEPRHEGTKSNYGHRPIIDRPAWQTRIKIIARKAIEKMVRDLDRARSRSIGLNGRPATLMWALGNGMRATSQAVTGMITT
jgi:hypothetical protein